MNCKEGVQNDPGCLAVLVGINMNVVGKQSVLHSLQQVLELRIVLHVRHSKSKDR